MRGIEEQRRVEKKLKKGGCGDQETMETGICIISHSNQQNAEAEKTESTSNAPQSMQRSQKKDRKQSTPACEATNERARGGPGGSASESPALCSDFGLAGEGHAAENIPFVQACTAAPDIRCRRATYVCILTGTDDLTVVYPTEA